MTDAPLVAQPTYAGSTLAVLSAACVTGVLAGSFTQGLVVGVETVGALLLLGSGLVRRRGHRVLGGGFVLVGCGLVCSALGMGLLSTGGLFERIAFLGGTLAMAVVVLGVFPLRESWTRTLVGVGVALFGCSLVLLTWVSDPDAVRLLVGVGSMVLTWDLAEYATTLGVDVGRSARTYPVVLTHLAGTLGTGAIAGVFALVVDGVRLPAIPIAAFALLLGASLLSLLVLFLGDSDWPSST
ncbi:DUF7519 family protein [Halococcus salsus]|uniref:DUF7519 family protein n=1 Tax=Halococcus salsus TaxID=2162894 RepID=UPI00135A6980|nr:hypothetical protein [Halococcus salsus]